MDKQYTITYSGKWLSINQAYNTHWTKAKKIKDTLKLHFTYLIKEAKIKPLSSFTLNLRYNSRLDADNTTAGLKCFVDTLTTSNIISDDTKSIYKGFSVTPDVSLKHNTYVITITAKSTCR